MISEYSYVGNFPRYKRRSIPERMPFAHRVNIRSYAFNAPTPKPDPLSLEQADCRRHGYALTNKTLGTGAYAKVKLARVTEKKLARNSKLREDLRRKGHDMVMIY